MNVGLSFSIEEPVSHYFSAKEDLFRKTPKQLWQSELQWSNAERFHRYCLFWFIPVYSAIKCNTFVFICFYLFINLLCFIHHIFSVKKVSGTILVHFSAFLHILDWKQNQFAKKTSFEIFFRLSFTRCERRHSPYPLLLKVMTAASYFSSEWKRQAITMLKLQSLEAWNNWLNRLCKF